MSGWALCFRRYVFPQVNVGNARGRVVLMLRSAMYDVALVGTKLCKYEHVPDGQ